MTRWRWQPRRVAAVLCCSAHAAKLGHWRWPLGRRPSKSSENGVEADQRRASEMDNLVSKLARTLTILVSQTGNFRNCLLYPSTCSHVDT